ncbi:molybdate ABC transporter substrate-binding protein [Opitutales bacterium]|nr:molybdate ABC transporter substrate-binding protein [Opitutales bacterium]
MRIFNDPMKHTVLISLTLAVTLVACWYALSLRGTPSKEDSGSELTLYCAAGLQQPISQITRSYTENTGRAVNIIYNGSGALLSQIKLGSGDLYLPANSAYIDDAQESQLITECIPVALLTAIIAVHKDNKDIQSLEDLTKPGIRISFADKTAAIGRFARAQLIEHGAYAALKKNIIVTKPTVSNIIEDVALGSADATIAWRALASNHPQLRIIEVPLFTQTPQTTAIAILKKSDHPTAARDLANYISSAEVAREILQNYGIELPEMPNSTVADE